MQEVFYQLPHIKLCTLEHNPNQQSNIVLAFHGWLDNANSFLPLMAYSESFHVIAVEWPGHGHSDHRGSDASYQLLDYVYDIYALLKHNDWQKVHIVGHSLGAIIASIFAGTFPDMVERLVLIEALGAISATADDTRPQLEKSIVTRYKAQTKEPSNRLYSSTESAIQARLMVSDFNEEIATLLVTRSLIEVDGGYQWRSDPRLKQLSPLRMMEPQAVDLLKGICQPTMLILGESGYQSLRVKLTERMSVLPTLNVKSFAGGHHVHMEQPAQIWQAIEAHLTD